MTTDQTKPTSDGMELELVSGAGGMALALALRWGMAYSLDCESSPCLVPALVRTNVSVKLTN